LISRRHINLFIFLSIICLQSIFAQELEVKKEYYPNGKIKSEGTYRYGNRHGIYKEYYEGGKLWKEWNFEFGREEGISTWYFENGK
jgi:antitoxin component YwqK of YwqJK toxin-antitoxin module